MFIAGYSTCNNSSFTFSSFSSFLFSDFFILGSEFQQIKAALNGLQAIFPQEIQVEVLEVNSREEYFSWLDNNKNVSQSSFYFLIFPSFLLSFLFLLEYWCTKSF